MQKYFIRDTEHAIGHFKAPLVSQRKQYAGLNGYLVISVPSDHLVVAFGHLNRVGTPASEIDRLEQTNLSIVEEVSFRVVPE